MHDNTNMSQKFSIHNLHHESIKSFSANDPNLRRLKTIKLVFLPTLIKEFPKSIPGVYILTGGRQVGKTTLTKQWMLHLLEEGIDPQNISFITGDIISDYRELLHYTQEIIGDFSNKNTIKYLIIDEITYIKEWDRAIKFLVDGGYLEEVVLLLTGSDANVLKEARVRFPGRRGQAKKQDFELLPLSFKETILLKNSTKKNDNNFLRTQWLEYLQHGGYLTAINQFVSEKEISNATLRTYSDWIRGDFLKKNKNESTLKEVLVSLQKRLGSQITWNALSKELSIEHTMTLINYVEILSSMQIIYIQPALDQNKLGPAPKKAKKIHFQDPFIYHAILAWLSPVEDSFINQISQVENDPELSSRLSESVAVTHVNRKHDCYYIKAESEVDIAYIQEKQIFPIEVKWTKQLRSKELKQILKYPNSTIWSRNDSKELHGIKNVFLPRGVMDF